MTRCYLRRGAEARNLVVRQVDRRVQPVMVQVHAQGTQPCPHRVLVAIVVQVRGALAVIRPGEPGKMVDLGPAVSFRPTCVGALTVIVVVLEHAAHLHDLAL